MYARSVPATSECSTRCTRRRFGIHGSPSRSPTRSGPTGALDPTVLVPELWFLAFSGAEPAGIAMCNPSPGLPELGRVQVLGVRRPWRKRGVARALLLHAFAEFRSRGLTGAMLGVDAESLTGADRLYEQVGMHVAARFVVYEKAAG